MTDATKKEEDANSSTSPYQQLSDSPTPEDIHVIYYGDQKQEQKQKPELQTRITRDASGQITDIELLVDEDERNRFLRTFPDQALSWKDSCLTYIMQRGVAKYRYTQEEERQNDEQYADADRDKIDKIMERVGKYSEFFAQFERLINDPAGDPQRLLAMVQKYRVDMLAQLTQDINNEADSKIKAELEQLKANLDDGILEFIENIETIIREVPTERRNRKLFSILDESSKRKSLGGFMAKQMWGMLDSGIHQIYNITGRGPTNLLFLDPAIKALSDAKADIELRTSLYGMRYANTSSKVPTDMLNALTTDSVSAKRKQHPKKWLSIAAYVDPTNPKSVDGALNFFVEHGANDHPKKPAVALGSRLWEKLKKGLGKLFSWSFFKGLALFVATVVEAAVAIVRVGLQVAVAAVGIVAGLLSYIPFLVGFVYSPWATIGKALNAFDRFFGAIHKWLSTHALVSFWKKIWHGNYRSDNENEPKQPTDQTHRDALETVKNSASQSMFEKIASNTFSSNKILSGIGKQITDFWRSFVRGWNDFWTWRSEPYQKRGQELFAQMQNEIDEKVSKYVQERQKRLSTGLAQVSKTFADARASALPVETKVSMVSATAVQPRFDKYSCSTAWKPNELETAFDFFDDIITGLTELVVDPMFRKQPALATLYFILAHASLGTVMIPGAASSQYLSWLKEIPAWLSQNFTGKDLSEGMGTQIIACFLEWKVGFFATEALLEFGRFDFSGLEEIFQQPEKIVFGLATLVAAGYSLQFLPTLPETVNVFGHQVYNPLAAAVNIFSTEAASCAGGTAPFTSVEYAFLGLKFGLLTQAFLTTQGTIEIEKLDLEDLFKAVMSDLKKGKALEVSDPQQRSRLIKRAVNAYLAAKHITPPNAADNKTYKEIVAEIETAVTDTQKKFTEIKSRPEIEAQVIASLAAAKEKLKTAQPTSTLLPAEAKQVEAVENSSPEQQAWKKLNDAVQLVNQMDMLGKKFDSNKDACMFYDHLDHLFEQYNLTCRQAGRFDKQIDKREFMDSFYNKHCFVPAPLWWRMFRYIPNLVRRAFGTAYRWIYKKIYGENPADSPHIEQEWKKNRNGDLAFWIQILANVFRLAHAYGRGLNYTVRVALFILSPLLLVAAFFSLFFSPKTAKLFWNTFTNVPTLLSKVNIHRADWLAHALGPTYTEACRVAGITDNLRSCAQNTGTVLASAEPARWDCARFQPNAANQVVFGIFNNDKINIDQKIAAIRSVAAAQNLSHDSPMYRDCMFSIEQLITDKFNAQLRGRAVALDDPFFASTKKNLERLSKVMNDTRYGLSDKMRVVREIMQISQLSDAETALSGICKSVLKDLNMEYLARSRKIDAEEKSSKEGASKGEIKVEMKAALPDGLAKIETDIAGDKDVDIEAETKKAISTPGTLKILSDLNAQHSAILPPPLPPVEDEEEGYVDEEKDEKKDEKGVELASVTVVEEKKSSFPEPPNTRTNWAGLSH